MNRRALAGFSALILSVLACEPIFAIGWREIFIVVVLAMFLLGPPVYRFLRRLEEYRKHKDK